jgi:primary-amine oxidase
MAHHQAAIDPSAVLTAHPLDPLTAIEIDSAAEVIRGTPGFGERTRFVSIALAEPLKSEVLAWRPGDQVERRAAIVLYDRATRTTTEAVVSVTRGEVLSSTVVPDVQPGLMLEEAAACETAVKSDARWQAAMRRRGVEEPDLAMVDLCPSAYTGPEDSATARRIARPLTWMRAHPRDNGYARPVEGLICTLDLDTMAVLDVEDHGGPPVPNGSGNFAPDLLTRAGNHPSVPALRDDVKPLEITQPEGPSFTLEGSLLRWQRWQLRLGFTPREGVVLHQVSYEDGGELRSIMYRAALSEMFVPYGDPAPTHWRKNVFDVGEGGIGAAANSLTLGCDCVGEIRYVDGVVNDQDGNPVTIPNAICLHEEDAGIAWKHTDLRTGEAEVRRMRRLVIQFTCTVGNYDYALAWQLYQDGTIEYEAKLTGIISTGAIAAGERPRHGVLVAPGVYGPHHQHFFCVRMDMAIDGQRNSVYEVESAPLPIGPENPHGNAWETQATLIDTEREAQRTIDPLRGRNWQVVNPSRLGATGEPVGYRLDPGANVAPMFQSGAWALARAGFCASQVWVTACDPAELYAAGTYPYQHPGGAGLPTYVQADRPLEDADVVLWYSFGAHHVVRPEDWPIMPVTKIGFHLKPTGFFDANPAVDLPAPAANCEHECG